MTRIDHDPRPMILTYWYTLFYSLETVTQSVSKFLSNELSCQHITSDRRTNIRINIGRDRLTVLDILLPVEEPIRNLVLSGVLHDRHDLVNLFLGQLSGALGQVNVSLQIISIRLRSLKAMLSHEDSKPVRISPTCHACKC